MTFPKIYLGKFCQFFFSYFSQLLLLSSFFNKGNSCEIENSKNFDAMVEMIYFLNKFLHCKIIIRFLELPVVYVFSRPSRQEEIHQFLQNSTFLSRLIPYCHYSTKFHVKWTKIFWDTCVSPPPAFNFSGRYNSLWVVCQIWFNKNQNFRVKLYYTKFST